MDRMKEKSTWIGLGIMLMEVTAWLFPEIASEIRTIGVPILAGTDIVRKEG